MKTEFVVNNQSDRLILLFAGWGMDSTPFRHLYKPGYDIAVVSDYRDMVFDAAPILLYHEIIVIGWSVGVYHADKVLSDNIGWPVTARIAVNGTLCPVNDELGIPESLFRRSAPADEAMMKKFYRRVAGGASVLEQMMPRLPRRSVDELRQELILIADRTCRATFPPEIGWDRVVISSADLIFPPEAMKRAWASVSESVTVIDGGAHLVDFQKLIDDYLADKELIGSRFSNASPTYNTQATVQRKVASRLARKADDLIPADRRKRARVLEIGTGAGMLTEHILKMFTDSDFELWDLADISVPDVDHSNRVVIRRCDAEAQFAGLSEASFDFIFTSSTIQWFNSPIAFLKRVASRLSPGGMAFIAFYGKGTFAGFGNEGLHYVDLTDSLFASVPGAFSRDSERLGIHFQTPSEALLHLRYTGVNSLRREPVSVGVTRRLMRQISNPDGTASLYFNANYLVMTNSSKHETIFVTGIDTDAGKSYCTAWLVNHLSQKGYKVLTQKFIQTGNVGRSEDLDLHRAIAGDNLAPVPVELAAPVIFSYPASPHLAARIDGKEVSLEVIDHAREQLQSQCDILLVEGAGGMMVPVDDTMLTVDYISSRRLPAAVVTNGRLGSINHTILTLEALKSRDIPVRYVLYNTYFDTDKVIADDTRQYLRRYVDLHFPEAEFIEVPTLKYNEKL